MAINKSWERRILKWVNVTNIESCPWKFENKNRNIKQINWSSGTFWNSRKFL